MGVHHTWIPQNQIARDIGHDRDLPPTWTAGGARSSQPGYQLKSITKIFRAEVDCW